MSHQAGFWDFEERLQRLSDIGDHLEAYAATVDFELFRADLDAALAYRHGEKGGCPPLDPVVRLCSRTGGVHRLTVGVSCG